jgi:hypothetical protein
MPPRPGSWIPSCSRCSRWRWSSTMRRDYDGRWDLSVVEIAQKYTRRRPWQTIR